MVHLLANHLRSEFLACPQLVRFDMVQGTKGLEPTLLIKASTLGLKYLLRRKKFRFVVTRVGSKIAYAVEIPDDPDAPAMAWSLLELPAEREALLALSREPRCIIFLFNELAVSVAWTEVRLPIEHRLTALISTAELHPKAASDDVICVGERLDEIHLGPVPDTQILSCHGIVWNEIRLSYVTNRIETSDLSLFSNDEGGQQEQIAVWLTDNLRPQGCVKSPQVHEKVVRELSDILLSHEFGAFLIESKALSILARENLPDRAKLAKDLVKHVKKAAKQLAGGIRNLRNGLPVTDLAGRELQVERDRPAHTMILVPDLSLLQDATEFGRDFILKFMTETGGFIHILDPAELLRVVQVAETVSRDSMRTTPMMAFDWYLTERAKIAPNYSSPYFEVLFRKELPVEEIS